MLIKKNDIDLKSFCAIDWRKERGLVRNNQLLNGVLAWMVNPFGDHGLEYKMLEALVLRAGLKRDIVKPVVSITHNSDMAGYHQDARAIDVLIETERGYLLIENRTALVQVDSEHYLKELKAKADWFKDNLRSSKANRILLLVPSVFIPSPLGEYVRRSTFFAVVHYQRWLDAITDLLLYEVQFNADRKFYAALERYKLFLQTYVVDLYHEEQLKLRVENIKAVL
jgi:hypothetical protein